MKLNKTLPLMMATLLLASCGGNSSAASSYSTGLSVPEQSSQPASVFEWLTFLGDNKVRFDFFNIEEGIQFSYGNSALPNGVNHVVAISDSAHITVNKNTAEDKSANAIFIAERSDGTKALHKANTGIDSTQLVEFFDLVKDALVGYTRAYVAISFGQPQWTKGLNDKMDITIEALIK